MVLLFLGFLGIIFILSIWSSFLFEKIGKKEKYNWIFSLFHFVCGFLLAGLFSFFFQSKFIILLFAMSVGFVWEAYELLIDRIKFLKKIYARFFQIQNTTVLLKDTLFDLCWDLLGVIFWLVFCVK